MKGVILAGGLGTRLGTLTQVTNKHLLPVFDKPMIYYPIDTLVRSGIKDVMIIVSGPHTGDFIPILQNGKQFGLDHIEYAYQSRPDGGIADALALAEDFADGEKIAVILGDNTMEPDQVAPHIQSYKHYFEGAQIFLKKVPEPCHFGVPRFNDQSEIEEIIEKPSIPPSPYAVIGLYLYDNKVFDFVKTCKPSGRGQLEITDVNNLYLQNKKLTYRIIDGFWQDAGTFENLYLANKYWYEKRISSGK